VSNQGSGGSDADEEARSRKGVHAAYSPAMKIFEGELERNFGHGRGERFRCERSVQSVRAFRGVSGAALVPERGGERDARSPVRGRTQFEDGAVRRDAPQERSSSREVEGFFVLGRTAGGVDGERVAPASQVAKQAVDFRAVEEDGDEAKPSLAPAAGEDVEAEGAPHERGPRGVLVALALDDDALGRDKVAVPGVRSERWAVRLSRNGQSADARRR
jgi:hypothetical protein